MRWYREIQPNSTVKAACGGERNNLLPRIAAKLVILDSKRSKTCDYHSTEHFTSVCGTHHNLTSEKGIHFSTSVRYHPHTETLIEAADDSPTPLFWCFTEATQNSVPPFRTYTSHISPHYTFSHTRRQCALVRLGSSSNIPEHQEGRMDRMDDTFQLQSQRHS